MVATKEAILNAQDWDFDVFPVQGWGDLRIRSLSAEERLILAAQYAGQQLTNSDACDFYLMLIALSAVDDAGKQLFEVELKSEHNKKWFEMGLDARKLIGRNWNRLKSVAEKIMAFNGMGESDTKELEKN